MRQHGMLSGLLFLSLAACATNPQVGAISLKPSNDPDPFSRCASIDDEGLRTCLQTVEQGLFGSFGASRPTEHTLLIRGTGGGVQSFVDDTSDSADHVEHHYAGFNNQIGLHIIRVDYYEGGAWLAVTATASASFTLFGPPVVAPGGHRFATANAELEANYSPNGIEVWSANGGTYDREVALSGGERWGAENLRWLSPDELAFTYLVAPIDSSPPPACPGRLRLFLNGHRFEHCKHTA